MSLSTFKDQKDLQLTEQVVSAHLNVILQNNRKCTDACAPASHCSVWDFVFGTASVNNLDLNSTTWHLNSPVFPQVQLVSMTNVKIKRQRGKEISLIQHNCLRTSLSATSYLFIQRQQVRNVF